MKQDSKTIKTKSVNGHYIFGKLIADYANFKSDRANYEAKTGYRITGHYPTHQYGWFSAIENLAQLNDDNHYLAAANLFASSLIGKINLLERFGKILLYKNGSYRNCPLDINIVEQVIRDDLIYPDDIPIKLLDEKDIRIISWAGGKHYYAKVNDLDVMSKSGDAKWNTEKEAMRIAKEFIKEYNKGVKCS